MNEGSCRVGKKDGIEELGSENPKLGGWFKGVIGAIVAFALVVLGIVLVSMALGNPRTEAASAGTTVPIQGGLRQPVILETGTPEPIVITPPYCERKVGTEWYMPFTHDVNTWGNPRADQVGIKWQVQFKYLDAHYETNIDMVPIDTPVDMVVSPDPKAGRVLIRYRVTPGQSVDSAIFAFHNRPFGSK